jgi:hypothetical protein
LDFFAFGPTAANDERPDQASAHPSRLKNGSNFVKRSSVITAVVETNESDGHVAFEGYEELTAVTAVSKCLRGVEP